MNTNRGFTLIEVMLIVGIVAVMTAVAIPAWINITSANRRVVDMNTLHDALVDAQDEARTGGLKSVVICKAAAPETCETSTGDCCTTDGDWSQGWVIFRDDNDDKQMNSSDGDVYLKFGGPLSGGAVITGTGNSANWVKFLPGNGNMPSNNTNVITACSAGTALGRTLSSSGSISNSGSYTCP